MSCELCDHDGGMVLYRDPKLRVVLVDDANYPGFCRVIWQQHVREMTDLSGADRDYLMQMVWVCEAALRELLHPDKINLASLGNVTPHLHWHIIPRYADDPTFPAPVWAAASRAATRVAAAGLPEALRQAILVQTGQIGR